ncbi:MAG: hypothetical protein AABX47_06055 [Nanoarchaeota archaeon]
MSDIPMRGWRCGGRRDEDRAIYSAAHPVTLGTRATGRIVGLSICKTDDLQKDL